MRIAVTVRLMWGDNAEVLRISVCVYFDALCPSVANNVTAMQLRMRLSCIRLSVTTNQPVWNGL